MADLVAEVAEHRAVRLAEPHPQRFAVGVQRLDEVDGDDAVGVADRHLLALAVARQQIERQAAVAAPERVDRQADVAQLVRPADATPAPSAPASRAPMVSSASGSRRINESRQAPTALVRVVLLLGDQPVAAQRLRSGCSAPTLSVDRRPRRRRRRASTSSAGAGRASAWQVGHCVDSNGGEVVAHRAGECAHGPYRCHGAVASDPACAASAQRARAGLRPAPVRGGRRAGAAAAGGAEALSDHAIGQQPADPGRADRAAGGRRIGAARRDRRTARRVRPRHGALHPDRADRRRVPRGAGATGQWPSAEQRRRGRVSGPDQRGHPRPRRPRASTRTPSRCSPMAA